MNHTKADPATMVISSFLPDVILAGAPKCGTTSVFNYLKDHPQICASSEKETYFLMDKDYSLYQKDRSIHDLGKDGYTQFFNHCSNSKNRLRMEATPDYLYQETPLELIPQWPTIPMVLFILREPEDRIYSLYRFAKNTVTSIDKDMSFQGFVDVINNKSNKISNDQIISDAIKHGQYINYLRKWKHTLGADHVKIFLFDDLVKNPAELMKNICSYLSIDSSYFDDYEFGVSNKSIQVRFFWLHKWKKIISNILPNGRYKKTLGAIYAHLNQSVFKGKTEDEVAILNDLHKKFVKSNMELEQEFDVDLDVWR